MSTSARPNLPARNPEAAGLPGADLSGADFSEAGLTLTVADCATAGDVSGALRARLMPLGAESRRRRFFTWASDDLIEAYVAGARPAALIEAQLDGAPRGLAEVHVAVRGRPGTAPEAEIALEVDDGWQGRGIGAALLKRSLAEIRRMGIPDACMHFLKENRAMRRLAARAGFTALSEPGSAVTRAVVGNRDVGGNGTGPAALDLGISPA